MVDCQSQLEKLSFPCAVMCDRIYSRTHFLDEQNIAVYSHSLSSISNRLTIYALSFSSNALKLCAEKQHNTWTWP